MNNLISRQAAIDAIDEIESDVAEAHLEEDADE